MSTIKVDTVQSTGGGAVTLTKQDAAKAWYVFDGGRTSSTVAIEDDFNISSLLDSSGAGNTTLNFASNMNSATTYTVVNSTFITSTQSNMSGCVSRTTSSHVIQDSHDNGSQTDMERTYGVVFGDLA